MAVKQLGARAASPADATTLADLASIQTPFDRAMVRRPSAGFNRLIGVGDSFSVGNGSTGGNTGFQQQLATSTGLTLTNCGGNGALLEQYLGDPTTYSGTTMARSLTLTQRDLVSTIMGYNDLRTFGPAPDKILGMGRQVEAVVGWLGVSDANRVFSTNKAGGANPVVTYVGSWNYTYSSPTMNTNFAAYSSGSSASIQFSLPAGDTIYLWHAKSGATGDNANHTITVDGAQVSYYSNILNHTSGSSWSIYLTKIRGLNPNTTHTLKVSGDSNGHAFMVYGAACFNSKAPNGPTVLAGLCTNLAVANWSLAGQPTANGSTANSATGASAYLYDRGGLMTWHNEMRQSVDRLFRDGINAILVDTTPFWDEGTMQNGDNIHPNDQGHRALFDAFNQYALPLTRGY